MLTFCLKSLWNRRFIAFLSVLSIALSVALIVGMERLRTDARASFANSASGVDLIVASRGNSIQILMATIFGTGSTGRGMTWDSFEMIEGLPQVEWAVPVSMGDNHRGFPVFGTTDAYFTHFRHSGGKPFEMSQGRIFKNREEAVIGADVAERFGYKTGDEIIVAHGAGNVAFALHDKAPFTVAGILATTNTAADRQVYVSLEGFDALHAQNAEPAADPFDGLAAPSDPTIDGGSDHEDTLTGQARHAHENVLTHSEEQSGQEENAAKHDHEPDQINAVLIGLSNRTASLAIQRTVSDYAPEPLTAVLPGAALLQLWSITSTAENALKITGWAVAVAGLLGMVVMLTATLEARRREFAILRSVGATPSEILVLIVLEAFCLSLAGIILGTILSAILVAGIGPTLAERFGIAISLRAPSLQEIRLVGIILVFGLVASLIPAMRVYRMTLADGLAIKL